TDKPNEYRILSSNVFVKEDDDADMTAFNAGYVSITPLQLDRTDYRKLKKVFNKS
ncbi:MAG TPA: hypothetical protein GX698_04530, partial [Acholeplasmataceae bacterium]|nr:hypothetical protein [Acholeplasmataceae bacterium]